MSKFCKECGKPIADGVQFCKHCGTKVNKAVPENKAPQPEAEKTPIEQSDNGEKRTRTEQQTRQVKKEKKPMSKKKKVLTAIIGFIVLCGIGLGVWGNMYYSEENTAKRFADAIAEGDTESVQEMVTVDGKTLSNEEANAVTAMKDEEEFAFISDRDPDTLFDELSVFEMEQSDDKAFLVFTQYHVAAEPQYVTVYSNVEGVQTTFNGGDFEEQDAASDYIEYGPLAPGMYEAASSFETDYGEAAKSRNVLLMDMNNSYDSELEVGEVTFYEMFDANIPYDSMELMINEEPLEMNTDSDYVTAGPLLLDGSMELTGVVKTDWGDLQIDPIAITDREHDVYITDLLNEGAEEDIKEVITGFSEGYVEAIAKLDASVIENISEELSEELEDELFVSFDEYGFSGRLDEIGIAFADAEYYSTDNPAFQIPVQLKMTGTYDQDSEYEEINVEAAFIVQYQTDSGKWDMYYFSDNFDPGDVDYTFFDASGEEYEGVVLEEEEEDDENSEDDRASEDEELTEIKEVVENYVDNLVWAINTGDYTFVENYIASGSDLDTMQQDLVERLYDSGLTQEMLSVSVEDIEEIDSETWEVTTNESIELRYASGETEEEDYQWTYTVELTDDGYQLTNLE
ncbi:TcaA NTF2-like domain-containing protein [Oceanobacillus jeddahense]|uniref:TcaA NTF2-like domain-containing protein n=1 Tax=Oceanobacillus jeddahense TaxID=1462527 RepID=UPI000595BF11|nr:zinc-ribbon domain-containing protein [Oceanobacillus jeddahense]